MIMPLPKTSWACAMLPFSPGTTRCALNPKALHSHSIAADASRYRMPGMTVDVVFGVARHRILLERIDVALPCRGATHSASGQRLLSLVLDDAPHASPLARLHDVEVAVRVDPDSMTGAMDRAVSPAC